MPSLLVFAHATQHPDPAEQWRRFVPGDVIDISANTDQDWGSDVAALGWWRVVQTSAPLAALVHLLHREPEDELRPFAPYRLRLQRLRFGDVQPTMTLEQIQAATVDVDPVADPTVIG